jgi:hypothetical protein
MTAARRPRSAAFVRRLDVGNVGERPQRRPELQEVLRERAHVPLPLSRRAPLEQRPHLLLDHLDPLLERGAVAVVLELVGCENPVRATEIVHLQGMTEFSHPTGSFRPPERQRGSSPCHATQVPGARSRSLDSAAQEGCRDYPSPCGQH